LQTIKLSTEYQNKQTKHKPATTTTNITEQIIKEQHQQSKPTKKPTPKQATKQDTPPIKQTTSTHKQ